MLSLLIALVSSIAGNQSLLDMPYGGHCLTRKSSSELSQSLRCESNSTVRIMEHIYTGVHLGLEQSFENT